MSSAELLRVERISRIYPDGHVHALREVSFSVQAGEYVAIMGPSGCGKSTLLNLLGALDRPTSGEIYYQGAALSSMPHLDRFRSQQVGFIFQSFFLIPTLSAVENVQIPMFEGKLRAAQRQERAAGLLRAVGMAERMRHLPPQLSGGERQRVAIARALANEPSVLLADEPTGNLDSKTSEEILELFERLHRDEGMTMILITHAPEVAERAGRILRMQDGRVKSDTRPLAKT
jgi:putative ABC transport system ATP-binding protein